MAELSTQGMAVNQRSQLSTLHVSSRNTQRKAQIAWTHDGLHWKQSLRHVVLSYMF